MGVWLIEQGIVHGDLKPQNILIFDGKDDSKSYVPKVADFGFSTRFAAGNDKRRIQMPGTWPWHALEWHHRFTTTDIVVAKKLDAYSFGLLCAWILFYNTAANEKHDLYNDFEPEGAIPVPIGELLVLRGFSQDQEDRLRKLFEISLAKDPAKRSWDFKQLIQLLSPER